MADWYRITYRATSQDGTPINDAIDIHVEQPHCWATYRAMRRQHPEIDVMRAIDILHALPVWEPKFLIDDDPRDSDEQVVRFEVEGE